MAQAQRKVFSAAMLQFLSVGDSLTKTQLAAFCVQCSEKTYFITFNILACKMHTEKKHATSKTCTKHKHFQKATVEMEATGLKKNVFICIEVSANYSVWIIWYIFCQINYILADPKNFDFYVGQCSAL